jgi:hypothetical protein
MTSFCGKCGAAWQDGELLNTDRNHNIKFVKENWKHGRTLRKVMDELMEEMGDQK